MEHERVSGRKADVGNLANYYHSQKMNFRHLNKKATYKNRWSEQQDTCQIIFNQPQTQRPWNWNLNILTDGLFSENNGSRIISRIFILFVTLPTNWVVMFFDSSPNVKCLKYSISHVIRPFVWSSHIHKTMLQIRAHSLFYLMRLLYHYH